MALSLLSDPLGLVLDTAPSPTPTPFASSDDSNVPTAEPTPLILFFYPTADEGPSSLGPTAASVSTVTPSASQTAVPSDILIGGIPLPALIVLCIFGPFALSFLMFIVWKYTVRRYQDRKQLRAQARLEEGTRKVQVQSTDVKQDDVDKSAAVSNGSSLPEMHEIDTAEQDLGKVNFSRPMPYNRVNV